ncbi:MAG: DUF123 domain-containing protein [Thermodesulfobacteriota bacterium]|nr:DUF123 domain-containing protein [Thermodesulfobacteriota bacterium]
MEKRLQRHFRREKRIRWHIDYLLAGRSVKLQTALCKAADKDEECRIADVLKEKAMPVNGPGGLRGFGASDCSCKSHLFALPAALSKQGIAGLMAMTHEMKKGSGVMPASGFARQ